MDTSLQELLECFVLRVQLYQFDSLGGVVVLRLRQDLQRSRRGWTGERSAPHLVLVLLLLVFLLLCTFIPLLLLHFDKLVVLL